MGTRHLICAVVDGQTKIAQYGQWGGYPAGQGVKILNFLRNIPARFADNLRACHFGTEDEINEAYAPFSTNGFVTMDQSDAFKKSKFGHLSRDTSADILLRVAIAPRMLNDASDFANDTMFCEWAYTIDMDARELRVTNGLGTDTTFSFDDLPSDADFIKQLDPED